MYYVKLNAAHKKNLCFPHLSEYIKNLPLAGRTLTCDFKNAWPVAEKYHGEAQRAGVKAYDFAKSDSWLARVAKFRTFFWEI